MAEVIHKYMDRAELDTLPVVGDVVLFEPIYVTDNKDGLTWAVGQYNGERVRKIFTTTNLTEITTAKGFEEAWLKNSL